MKASVTHGFVLVTANPIDTLFPGKKKLLDLKEDEAVIDLEAMKSWFPTGTVSKKKLGKKDENFICWGSVFWPKQHVLVDLFPPPYYLN